MNNWIIDNFGYLVVGFIVLLFFAIFKIAEASCHGQWERSGLATDWGPIKGCLVNLPDGLWIPSDTLRDMDWAKVSK
jgi:hypothetical protein